MLTRNLRLGLLAGTLIAGAVYAGAIEVDFNPKAEFARYKTWGWIPDREKGQRGVLMDPIMRGRVEEALTIRLREAGLVAAAEGQTPDLLVAYRGDTGQGKSGSSNLGGLSSLDNPVYSSVQFTEQTATLMVDLVDASTKSLAWRLYIDQSFQGPNDPPDKLKQCLVKGFAKYPPTKSAIAKKARELEKASK
jgi:hypothetical protein